MTKAEFDAKTLSKFKRLDRNGDGVIDQTEAEARISERMEREMQGRHSNRMVHPLAAIRYGRKWPDYNSGKLSDNQ